MADYGTIKIPRNEYERHNDRRDEKGLTWAEYIDGQAPADIAGSDVIAQKVADRIAEDLGTPDIPEPSVDEDAIARSITNDLLSQLPPKIAGELQ